VGEQGDGNRNRGITDITITNYNGKPIVHYAFYTVLYYYTIIQNRLTRISLNYLPNCKRQNNNII